MPRGSLKWSVPTSSVLVMNDTVAEAGARRPASRWESQRSFDELGRPLRDITFCVVDLETTGGSAQGGALITEVGALEGRGGEGVGEVPTPVNPPPAHPAVLAGLTRIT